MRKKWIVLLLAGLVFCSLSACQKDCHDTDSSQESGYDTDDQTKTSKKTDSAKGLTSLIHRTGLFDRYCSTDDGFYYLTEEDSLLEDGSYAPHLMYMDYATCQEVYLCSDSSCQHNTKDCTSVLPGALSDGRIFIWDGYLYFLDRSADTSGSSIVDILGDSGSANVQADQAQLYRMNPDGSGRELVYRFDADAAVEDTALGNDDGLYFVTKKLDTKDSGSGTYTAVSDRQLICLDPQRGCKQNHFPASAQIPRQILTLHTKCRQIQPVRIPLLQWEHLIYRFGNDRLFQLTNTVLHHVIDRFIRLFVSISQISSDFSSIDFPLHAVPLSFCHSPALLPYFLHTRALLFDDL